MVYKIMQLYVFGYGSLMNPKSLARTLPGERAAQRARIAGYKRRMNVPYSDKLYLNIVPRDGSNVHGVLIPIDHDDLALLKEREREYECVDVTEKLDEAVEGIVYSFIAPDVAYPGLKIPRSYIMTCLGGVPEDFHYSWLEDTIIENEIEEDVENPVYENVVLERESD